MTTRRPGVVGPPCDRRGVTRSRDGHDADGLIHQSPKRELDDPIRRWVDPPRVIDRDEYRGQRSKRTDRRVRGDGDSSLVRRGLAWIVEQGRDPQRASLRDRQSREDIVENALKQVAEHGERERRLGLDRTAREDGEPRARASATVADHSADLPLPTPPSMSSAAVPAAASSRNRPTVASALA
jgi:hypothetical protein